MHLQRSSVPLRSRHRQSHPRSVTLSELRCAFAYLKQVTYCHHGRITAKCADVTLYPVKRSALVKQTSVETTIFGNLTAAEEAE